MDSKTKIVFIHSGFTWYLPYVLNQAVSVNASTDIILLGDGFNAKGVQCENLKELQSDNTIAFCKRYIHMSTNRENFELFCWLRWFYLLEYMQRKKIHSVLHLDSDVLLYSSIQDIKNSYSEPILDCAFLIPKQDHNSYDWVASGHISYWTIDSLEEFCKFVLKSFVDGRLLDFYKEKWQWHKDNNKGGAFVI